MHEKLPMGFYIDLRPVTPTEFKETEIPFVFYTLFAISGFALLCMGLASHMLLADLAKVGTAFDFTIIGAILLSVPFYLVMGLKLFFVKKFVSVREGKVSYGFTFKGKAFYKKEIPYEDISSVELVNKRPTKNVAPVMHNNVQYHIQGHWRIVLNLKNGKSVVVDKHTDIDALQPLYRLLTDIKLS